MVRFSTTAQTRTEGIVIVGEAAISGLEVQGHSSRFQGFDVTWGELNAGRLCYTRWREGQGFLPEVYVKTK